jgi:glycosyltransferase involved in cell wall biosynthesis
MPRILFLTKAPPYRNTGAEQVVWGIGQHLAANGWDVHFLTPGGDNTPDIEDVTFHGVKTPDSFFAEKAAFFLRGASAYLELRSELDPDLVYDNPSPFPFPYAHLLDSDRLVAKVHAVYGLSAFRNKHHPITKIGTLLGEQLYRGMDGRRLLTISESTKHRLGKRVRRNADDIIVVENGIEYERFEYRFNPDGPVLSLCELTPRKNVACLLRAWSRLEADGLVDRPLVIAGDGPRRTALEELASELSLSSVTFEGHVPEDEKLKLFSDAFCYVLPTQMEGFGLANLEAMASGCITVTTDTPGVRDYLVDGTNGRMVPPNDSQTLAETLADVLAAPNSQEPLAKAGRETAAAHDRTSTLERERHVLERMVNQCM